MSGIKSLLLEVEIDCIAHQAFNKNGMRASKCKLILLKFFCIYGQHVFQARDTESHLKAPPLLESLISDLVKYLKTLPKTET